MSFHIVTKIRVKLGFTLNKFGLIISPKSLEVKLLGQVNMTSYSKDVSVNHLELYMKQTKRQKEQRDQKQLSIKKEKK